MNNLNKKLQNGLLWSVIQVLIKRVFDLFVKLVLLNILFPEDFGLVGIATAITSIIYVISELGLKDALIQRKKTLVEDLHYQSVFWWALIWSLIIFLFVFVVITPFASGFYDEPLLNKILPILTFPIVIQSLTIVYRVKFLRALNFKVIAVISSISSVVAGVLAIVIALKGGGFWSLVLYILLPFLIALPFYILLLPWRPKMIFSFTFLKQIFVFGKYIFGTSLVLIIATNIDYLFIGKLISTKLLGFYSFSYMLTFLIFKQVTSMIDRVLYPFYSKIQGNILLVKKYYLNSLKFYLILLAPVMLSLIILSSPIIKFFIGIKWIIAATSLRILALAVLINLTTHGCTMVFRSLGKPKLELKILLSILIFITVPGIYFGSFYGINGVALALLLSSIVNAIVSLYFLNRELDIKILEILTHLKPAIIALILSCLAVTPIYLLFSFNVTFLLLIILIVYGVTINYFYTKEIRQFISKTFFPKRS